MDPRHHATDNILGGWHADREQNPRNTSELPPEVVTVVSQHGRPDNGSDAAGFNNAEFFVPLKPFEEWPPNLTKENLVDELQTRFAKEFVGVGFNFLAIYPGQRRGGLVRCKRRQFGEDHRPRFGDAEIDLPAGDARDGKCRRCDGSSKSSSSWPAEFKHQSGSRQGCPLWA